MVAWIAGFAVALFGTLGALGALGGWVAARKRRRAVEGAALGFLFGPLGVLVEALLPSNSQPPPPLMTAADVPYVWVAIGGACLWLGMMVFILST